MKIHPLIKHLVQVRGVVSFAFNETNCQREKETAGAFNGKVIVLKLLR